MFSQHSVHVSVFESRISDVRSVVGKHTNIESMQIFSVFLRYVCRRQAGMQLNTHTYVHENKRGNKYECSRRKVLLWRGCYKGVLMSSSDTIVQTAQAVADLLKRLFCPDESPEQSALLHQLRSHRSAARQS